MENLPKNEGYALAASPEDIRAITNPTLWDKIRSLPAEDFVEYLYLIVASMFEQNGIDFEITEENKAATLAQLTQPHVGYKHG